MPAFPCEQAADTPPRCRTEREVRGDRSFRRSTTTSPGCVSCLTCPALASTPGGHRLPGNRHGYPVPVAEHRGLGSSKSSRRRQATFDWVQCYKTHRLQSTLDNLTVAGSGTLTTCSSSTSGTQHESGIEPWVIRSHFTARTEHVPDYLGPAESPSQCRHERRRPRWIGPSACTQQSPRCPAVQGKTVGALLRVAHCR